jgi:hypothetical protein
MRLVIFFLLVIFVGYIRPIEPDPLYDNKCEKVVKCDPELKMLPLPKEMCIRLLQQFEKYDTEHLPQIMECIERAPCSQLSLNDCMKTDPSNREKESSRVNATGKLYVTSITGLSVRKLPSLNSEILGIIPFNEMIISYGIDENEINFKGIKGSFRIIRYNNKKAYVFSGFLSNKKINVLDPNISELNDKDINNKSFYAAGSCEGDSIPSEYGYGIQFLDKDKAVLNYYDVAGDYGKCIGQYHITVSGTFISKNNLVMLKWNSMQKQVEDLYHCGLETSNKIESIGIIEIYLVGKCKNNFVMQRIFTSGEMGFGGEVFVKSK